MPPLPSWDSLHPLVVHFPIALLITAPVFIVLAAVWRKAWKPLGAAALVLLVLGTLGAMLSVATGEAGESAAKAVPASKAVLERHEDLAELTQMVFIALTVLFGMILSAALLIGRHGPRVFTIASLIFLLPYAAGTILLANTAHEGGRLVHEFGVRAPMAGGTGVMVEDKSPAAATRAQRRHDD